jgi:hypothetical protein
MVKSLAGSKENAEETIELFLVRQGPDTQITDDIASSENNTRRREDKTFA